VIQARRGVNPAQDRSFPIADAIAGSITLAQQADDV
jgi:hypothetical protein